MVSSVNYPNGQQKAKTPLARKVSPCIVITDTERQKRRERNTSMSPTESGRLQSEISSKCHDKFMMGSMLIMIIVILFYTESLNNLILL